MEQKNCHRTHGQVHLHICTELATKMRRCLGTLSTVRAAGTQEPLPDKGLCARTPCKGQTVTKTATLILPVEDYQKNFLSNCGWFISLFTQ